MLTLETLKKHLKYDPHTGKWTRLIAANNASPVGSKVGCIVYVGKDRRPYLYVSLLGRKYKASRLAWFYVTGHWPMGIVDHWDGDSLNDRFDNFRDCTQQQNTWNRRIGVSNTSGFKGVARCSARNCWRATITVSGKTFLLGEFSDPALAGEAYKKAAEEHFGKFARA